MIWLNMLTFSCSSLPIFFSPGLHFAITQTHTPPHTSAHTQSPDIKIMPPSWSQLVAVHRYGKQNISSYSLVKNWGCGICYIKWHFAFPLTWLCVGNLWQHCRWMKHLHASPSTNNLCLSSHLLPSQCFKHSSTH